jgi:hypothetical protein
MKVYSVKQLKEQGKSHEYINLYVTGRIMRWRNACRGIKEKLNHLTNQHYGIRKVYVKELDTMRVVITRTTYTGNVYISKVICNSYNDDPIIALNECYIIISRPLLKRRRDDEKEKEEKEEEPVTKKKRASVDEISNTLSNMWVTPHNNFPQPLESTQ